MCNSFRNDRANPNLYAQTNINVQNINYNYISNYAYVTANIPRNEYRASNRDNVRLYNLQQICSNIKQKLDEYLKLDTSFEFTHGKSGKNRALLLSHLLGNIKYNAIANVIDNYESIFQNYIIIYAKKQDFFKAFRGQIKVDSRSSMTYVIEPLYVYFKYYKANFEHQNRTNENLFIFLKRVFSDNPNLNLNEILHRKAVLSNIQRMNIIQLRISY